VAAHPRSQDAVAEMPGVTGKLARGLLPRRRARRGAAAGQRDSAGTAWTPGSAANVVDVVMAMAVARRGRRRNGDEQCPSKSGGERRSGGVGDTWVRQLIPFSLLGLRG
jgi:hypothetical protein